MREITKVETKHVKVETKVPVTRYEANDGTVFKTKEDADIARWTVEHPLCGYGCCREYPLSKFKIAKALVTMTILEVYHD